MHAAALFGEGIEDSSTAAQFWAAANLQTAAWAERSLASRYVRARIEDLCGPDRENHVRELAGRLGLSRQDATANCRVFSRQPSFGRWRRAIPCDIPSDPFSHPAKPAQPLAGGNHSSAAIHRVLVRSLFDRASSALRTLGRPSLPRGPRRVLPQSGQLTRRRRWRDMSQGHIRSAPGRSSPFERKPSYSAPVYGKDDRH